MAKKKDKKYTQLVDYFKTEFGILASTINQENLLIKNVPMQIRDEIPTLNKTGYMKIDLDELSEEFIKEETGKGELLLELGCAYGAVVSKVLNKGARIIASDLSQDHLSVILKNTSKTNLENLYLYPASFPDEITLPAGSLGAVFSGRMLHFLNGELIERGLDKIHEWLKPNGKFYFTAVSPYHNVFRDAFLHVYNERVENKEKWPGIIENQWLIAPEHKEYVGQFINLFDIPQLEKLLPEHGFKIDKIKLFDYPNDVDSNNKGHIGFVATKI